MTPDIVERLRERHAAWIRECGLEGKELPYEFRESTWSAAADEIDRLRAAVRWQPIETAPRDGTRIIIAWGGVTTTGKYLDNSKAPYMPWAGWVPVSGDPWPKGKPTHWQPLPSPPDQA